MQWRTCVSSLSRRAGRVERVVVLRILSAIAHTEVSGLGNVVDFSAHGPISPRGGWG